MITSSIQKTDDYDYLDLHIDGAPLAMLYNRGALKQFADINREKLKLIFSADYSNEKAVNDLLTKEAGFISLTIDYFKRLDLVTHITGFDDLVLNGDSSKTKIVISDTNHVYLEIDLTSEKAREIVKKHFATLTKCYKIVTASKPIAFKLIELALIKNKIEALFLEI